jgi:hypothetical protein
MGVKAAAIVAGLGLACACALATAAHARKAVQTDVAALNPDQSVAQQAQARYRRPAAAVRKRTPVGQANLTAHQDDVPPLPNFSEAVGWRLIEDQATGARLGLPEKLVPRAGLTRTGSRWTSAQGQILVETFRLSEAALPALFEEEKKAARREITSSDLKPDSFTIAGVQGLKNFLVRAVARGGEVRGITILYDQATQGTMDGVARAMAAAFTGFPDLNAAPLPGLRRSVEYGSAIVVTSGGDLIAPAHVTDDCQAITVPPLGHAERVAEDKTNDLALLRLYGARDLVPAPIGAEPGPGQGSDLMVVGVADPFAQAGEAGVTSVPARITAQGVEPAPKPGFSGAAAVDLHGNLAGMVDVRPAIVAGSGPAVPGAMLVLVEAIRAFLQAQRVAPAADFDHAAMDRSVMRVICVRR